LLIIKRELIILVKGLKLEVDYKSPSSFVLFDICDLDGRIHISGKIEPNILHNINVAVLKKGQFHFFIIDEGEVVRQLFNLDS